MPSSKPSPDTLRLCGCGGLRASVRVPLHRFVLEVDWDTPPEVRAMGLCGVSGSGKTSFLDVLAGLRACEGRVSFGGQVWLDSGTGVCLPPQKRAVGYVPQGQLLFPHWSAAQNLRAGLSRASSTPAEAEALFGDVTEALGLAPVLRQSVETLSGGERQRVALGRALCSGARLMLLDEPFSGFDRSLRSRAVELIRYLIDRFDASWIIVSHNPSDLEALCQQTASVEEGLIRQR